MLSADEQIVLVLTQYMSLTYFDAWIKTIASVAFIMPRTQQCAREFLSLRTIKLHAGRTTLELLAIPPVQEIEENDQNKHCSYRV